MLTRRGWGLTIGALGLVLAGRLLGLLELYVLAAGAWALMGAALAFLALRTAGLEATRTLHPSRLPVGEDSQVELIVANRGRRPTPVVERRDPVDGGPRRARLLLAPMPPGREERVSYRIPTDRRGVLRVGPLEARRFDPLALATSARTVAAPAELVVHPAVEQLLALPHAPGDDRRRGFRPATAMGVTGDDFYALRPWVVGEDLRRVHWPSTARRDELMVRQHDIPWQGRATVVVDLRSRYHDEASLEQAVSAAASIAVSTGRSGSLIRLVGTDGTDTGFGAGPGHLEAILDRLARVQAGDGDLTHLADVGGAMALVVPADVPAADVARLARLAAGPGALTVVALQRKGSGPPRSTPGRTVLVGPGQPLAPAWNRAMAAAGGIRGAPA